MRTMLTATLDVNASNKAFLDGSLPKIVEKVMAMTKPEAAYFTTVNGCRACILVFDMKDASQIPAIAEPFFLNFNAKVEFSPVMNVEELQRGVAAAFAVETSEFTPN